MASVANSSRPAARAAITPLAPARTSTVRMRSLIALIAITLGLLLGCSSEPMDAKKSTSESISSNDSEVERMKVIVTLDPSVADVDTAVERISAKFPQAIILRTMASFSQLVIELPSDKLAALKEEKIVRSATADQTNKPMQNTP